MSIKARNCVCIHIGQAGLQVGHALWELLSAEHGINPDGTKKEETTDSTFRTFFQETPSGQFVPRALLIDLEPTVMDEIRTGSYKHLFHPELMVNGMEDTGSNFARGRITLGQHIMPILTEKIRFITEECDTVQGFFIFNSYGGGTGSGLGSFIAEKLAHEYSRRTRLSVAVFPGKRLGSSCVEPYNSLFFAQSVIKDIDISLAMDNDSLYEICASNLNFDRPSFVHTNRIISQVVSSLTCNIRFDGQLSGTLEEMRTNLIPYPTMSFPVTAFAPILHDDRLSHHELTTEQLIRFSFEKSHRLITSDLEEYAYMAALMYFRGCVSPNEINLAIRNLKCQRQFKWVDWCPTGFKLGINSQPPTLVPGSYMGDHTRSVLLLANSGSIAATLQRLKTQSHNMLKKKAFFHWYEREGLEFDDISNAIEDITVVEMDYREATKVVEVEEEEEEEDVEEEAPKPIAIRRPQSRPSIRPQTGPPPKSLIDKYNEQLAKNADEVGEDVGERQTDNSAEIVQKEIAKVTIQEYQLVEGNIDSLCEACRNRIATCSNYEKYRSEGTLPIYLLCKACIEGVTIKNKEDLCRPCMAQVKDKFSGHHVYNVLRVSDLCHEDASKFNYHVLRTCRGIKTILTHPCIRIEDICTACRVHLTTDDEDIYVSGGIYIDSMCEICEKNHKRELEIYARKAILASDLCESCKRQTHSVQPKLCKVWGGIEISDMCSRCKDEHEIDPESNMIDPSSLCDKCRSKINAITPTAYPVKGSISSEKVCNECKRRGRITSRDCCIDLTTLCKRCKNEIKNDIPKIYHGKGSFDIGDLCHSCKAKIPKKNKLNLDELCFECKTAIGGKGHDVTVRGFLDVRQICESCLESIKNREEGRGSVLIDNLCNSCKQQMRGRKDEIVVRGGISSAKLCGKCKSKVVKPISRDLLENLCDDCLDTIPKAGGIDTLNFCGHCTNYVKSSGIPNSNINFCGNYNIGSVNLPTIGTNNSVFFKRQLPKSSFLFKKSKLTSEAGDTGKTQNGKNEVFRRQLLTIVDRVTRCRECKFEGGLSIIDGCIRGGPSDFCDNCLIKLGLPNEFLVLCDYCRQNQNISISTFDLNSRPLSNNCISCRRLLKIDYQILQSLMAEYKRRYECPSPTHFEYLSGKPSNINRPNQKSQMVFENQLTADKGKLTNWKLTKENDKNGNNSKPSGSIITFIRKKLDTAWPTSTHRKV